jgi:hypothetical protein
MDLTNIPIEKLQKEIGRRSDDIWKLVDLYHDYFCEDDHNSLCQYYAESQLSDWKERQFHKIWKANTIKAQQEEQLTTTDFLYALQACTKVMEKFWHLKPSEQKLLQQMINNELR